MKAEKQIRAARAVRLNIGARFTEMRKSRRYGVKLLGRVDASSWTISFDKRSLHADTRTEKVCIKSYVSITGDRIALFCPVHELVRFSFFSVYTYL